MSKSSVLDNLFAALIFAFIAPILWLAHKINGNGSGSGPGFASFLIAAAIVIGSAAMIGVGLVAVVTALMV